MALIHGTLMLLVWYRRVKTPAAAILRDPGRARVNKSGKILP